MDETLNAQAYQLDCLAKKILYGKITVARQKAQSLQPWVTHGIIPDDLKMFIEPVKKSTCYRAVDRKNREVEKRTVTTDKLFILSESEIYGSDDGSDFDGTQYEYYRDKGTTSAYFFPSCEDFQRWTRSSTNSTECCYSYVDSDGSCHIGFADNEKAVCPAFCF